MFYRHTKEIFSRRAAKDLIDYYGGNGGHNLNTSRGELGYALFHYAMISNIRPERVLCVGSMKGFIPAICAMACKDAGSGNVDFVDAGYDEANANNWGGIGYWKSVDPDKHFSYAGLSAWVTTHVMTTEQFANTTRQRWQYIYIDGDHSYLGVKKDYQLFWPRLDKGCFMSFHDVLLRRHTDVRYRGFGVWKFWNEIPEKGKITIPFTYSKTLPSGLGILQKA
ncbi:class I SAM-dependent methyltransferase [Patescibacteria group bacterium]|nr:class I SAM-dependent methyltransferase [Patescibacteria group bacterium]